MPARSALEFLVQIEKRSIPSIITAPNPKTLMYVPPYFPEPVVVRDAAADAPYDVRRRFIQRVIVGHAATVGVATAIGFFAHFPIDLRLSAVALLVMFLVHCLARKLANSTYPEKLIQTVLLPFVLVACGIVGSGLSQLDWSVWVFPVAVTGGTIYAILAGRDFSFLGHFGAGLGTVLLILFFKPWLPVYVPGTYPQAIILGAITSFYVSYDLAMILRRRRPNEAISGICDLYGDVLNITTYAPRVIAHWKKFNI